MKTEIGSHPAHYNLLHYPRNAYYSCSGLEAKNFTTKQKCFDYCNNLNAQFCTYEFKMGNRCDGGKCIPSRNLRCDMTMVTYADPN